MVYARVARGLMLSLREVLFVEASRALGASNFRIITRHLLPNLLSPILVLATLELAVMMLTEASLSFLGLGIQPPESSWGLMLAEGREYLTTAPWLVATPGLAILFTTLSVNIIATWLRSRSTQSTYARGQRPPDRKVPQCPSLTVASPTARSTASWSWTSPSAYRARTPLRCSPISGPTSSRSNGPPR